MIEKILIAVITHFITVLIEMNQKAGAIKESEKAIDLKLESFKNAYKLVSTSEPLNKEQKDDFKAAVRNFLKSDNGGL